MRTVKQFIRENKRIDTLYLGPLPLWQAIIIWKDGGETTIADNHLLFTKKKAQQLRTTFLKRAQQGPLYSRVKSVVVRLGQF